MYSTPIAIAVIESPGMPKTSAGIQAPASALLLAAPDSTSPSGWPVPNFSGSFESFLLIAYDIQAAMSAPAPGSAPTMVPSTLPRRVWRQYLRASPPMPERTLPTCLVITIRLSPNCAKRSTSDTANRPIIAGIRLRPPSRSALPKVKRGWAAGFSRPTLPNSSPSSSVTKPFSGRSLAMKTAQLSPISTSQKYSKELKRSATSASAGAVKVSTIVPKIPPMAENTRPMPSAVSA